MTVGLAENSKPAWLENGLKPSWEKAFFFCCLPCISPQFCLGLGFSMLIPPSRMSAFTGKR